MFAYSTATPKRLTTPISSVGEERCAEAKDGEGRENVEKVV